MIWTAQNAKELRQRLGWSVAEMARRMGCKVETVMAWEQGTLAMDGEVQNQMRLLEGHVLFNSKRISQTPRAEELMDRKKLAQLTHRDLIHSESNE